jgi:creatinine amidohydrolase
MRKSTLLHELSWLDARDYLKENDLVILPVGSTEQHSSHLPLGTDFIIAEAYAREASKRTGVLCLPTIPIGDSAEHRRFPGTMFVSSETLIRYVRESLISLREHGVQKVIIVNGHGMNRYPLTCLIQELRQEKQLLVSLFGGSSVIKEKLPDLVEDWRPEGHGGIIETSLNLYINSNIVNIERAVNNLDYRIKIHDFGKREGFVLPEMSKGIAHGRAASSTAEIGKKMFDVVIEALVEHVEHMKKVEYKEWDEKGGVDIGRPPYSIDYAP